jgi:hypothetical protein
MNLKHELQSIISGIGNHSAEDLIKAAAYYIRESQKTSGNTEKFEFTKKQEAKKLNLLFHMNCQLFQSIN